MANSRDLRVVPNNGEIIDPGKVAPGWQWPKRKLATAGDAKVEIGRVYRLAAKGEIDPETMGKAVWALERFARVAEMADQERRIEELERALAEVTRRGR